MPRINHHPILDSQPSRQWVNIEVDGTQIEALAGEPIAVALLAAGIRVVRTMPETGAPRGVFTGVGRSIEELGSVDGESNVQLMKTPTEDGMVISTQVGLGAWEAGS